MNDPKWYGIGRCYRYRPTNTLAQALADWTNDISIMKQHFGLNTVRLAFCFAGSGGGVDNYVEADMDAIIDLLATNGFQVILDLHNYENMPGYFGSQAWINNWVSLAHHYLGDTRIVAFEIFNEPFKMTWAANVKNGGCDVAGGEDVAVALAACVDAIRAVDPSRTIVYPDTYFWRPPGMGYLPDKLPGYLKRNNIVLTFHEWQFGNLNIDQRKLRLSNWNAVMPCWIGEMGVTSTYAYPPQKDYLVALVDYAYTLGVGFNFWMQGYTSPQVAWSYLSDLMSIEPIPYFTLAVTSTPINVAFTVNQLPLQTPYNRALVQGTYTVTMPTAVGNYRFKNWEDGSTNPARTINLAADTSMIATYEVYVPPPVNHSLVVTSTPISGFAITVDGYQYTTPTQPITLQEGIHTVVAPSNVLVDADIYNFKHWEDDTTTPARTIDLTADLTVACTYELPPPPPPAKGTLDIHAQLDSQEIIVPYEIAGVGTGNTPATVEVNVGTYTVKATYQNQTKSLTVQVPEGQTIRVDFQFTAKTAGILSWLLEWISQFRQRWLPTQANSWR